MTIFRKSEIAETQLDEAIRQFLDHKNYICAVTLAGAAEAIFGALLQRENKPNALDRLYESWKQDEGRAQISQQDFQRLLNVARNQLKHAGDPQYDELKVTEIEPMLLIARAAGMHHAFAPAPTEQLVRFRDWWMANAEALIAEIPDPDIQESK